MNMDGYSKGSSDANYSDARTKPNGSNYMVVPLEMTMIMHMLGGMYAISDDITLMLMGSYFDNEMEMKKHSNGVKKKMKSSGWGDLKFNLIRYYIYSNENLKSELVQSPSSSTFSSVSILSSIGLQQS